MIGTQYLGELDPLSIHKDGTVALTADWGAGAFDIRLDQLGLLDTNATHHLMLDNGSNLTAGRTLSIIPGDADRTLTISGDATISQNYASTGAPIFADLTLAAIDAGTHGLTLDTALGGGASLTIVDSVASPVVLTTIMAPGGTTSPQLTVSSGGAGNGQFAGIVLIQGGDGTGTGHGGSLDFRGGNVVSGTPGSLSFSGGYRETPELWGDVTFVGGTTTFLANGGNLTFEVVGGIVGFYGPTYCGTADGGGYDFTAWSTTVGQWLLWDASESVLFFSDLTKLTVGNTSANPDGYFYSDGTRGVLGPAGDVLMGDGSLRTWHPQTTLMVDLGSGTYRFHDLYAENADLTGDLVVDGEIQGGGRIINYGKAASTSASSYLTAEGVTMTATIGFRMPKAGSIISNAVLVNVTTATSGTITFGVRINDLDKPNLGVVVDSAEGIGVKGGQATVIRDTYTFLAGDVITFGVVESGTMVWNNVLGTCEVVFDT